MVQPGPAGDHCVLRAICCIWSSIGSRKNWFADSSSNVSPLRSKIDQPRLSAALQRLFDREGLAPDEADRQQLAAAVSALASQRWPAARELERPPRWRGCSRCCAPARPEPRIALAAPTGKAAARLEEAVRAATAQLDLRISSDWASFRPHVASITGLAALESQPVPTRCHESAAARRRDRR
jgi:hypothetical protein